MFEYALGVTALNKVFVSVSNGWKKMYFQFVHTPSTLYCIPSCFKQDENK